MSARTDFSHLPMSATDLARFTVDELDSINVWCMCESFGMYAEGETLDTVTERMIRSEVRDLAREVVKRHVA
jgi:hypothetical protein